jgi:hypothetical protein
MSQRNVRPDEALSEAVDTLIISYPPLKADRKRIHFHICDGSVTVEGHLRTAITRRYLMERLPALDGVRSVQAEHLYDDETLQREAGRILAEMGADGALINMHYGVAVVTGTPPTGNAAQSLAERLAALPGVEKVVIQAA